MKIFDRLIITALLVVAAGCARQEKPQSVAEILPAVAVQTATVRRETQRLPVEITGTVRAAQRAALAAKISGSIVGLSVALGQTVKEGDVLVTISAGELGARVAQGRAQLAQVERELARERTLQSSGASAVDAVKLLEDRLAQSQAALREAETMVTYTTVRAPFAGAIAKKHVELGDFAAAGAPLLQLDGRNAFEIETAVPESLAAALVVGAALEVVASEGAARFRAVIAEISSAAEASSRTVTVKLTVPTGTAVRTGQFVRVLVPGAEVAALVVPTAAVSWHGQMERIFVVSEKNRASLRLVKTGPVSGARTEVLAGLAAGERVVVAPPSTLRDGQPLVVTP